MADYQSFEQYWLGKTTNYGATAEDIRKGTGYHCVPFAKVYLKYMCNNVEIGSLGNAIDWWNNPKHQLLELCDRIPAQTASQGDIVIKRPNHVGIATGQATATQVEILEQNGSTGNGKGQGADKVRKRFIDRSTIAGVYRIHQQTTKIEVKPSAWNVRTGPGLNNSVVAGNRPQVLAGQQYDAKIQPNGWALITFRGAPGYISGSGYKRV